MSSTVFDLSAYRCLSGPVSMLTHPAGILVPFGNRADPKIIAPHIRRDIASGDYSRDMIAMVPEALSRGDRVLVVGAGLGILAALIGRSPLARRIIAVEANPELIPHMERVKSVNGAGRIEVVSGVLGDGGDRLLPFYLRADFRDSSLAPGDGPWRREVRQPSLDLDLILAEERISLVVCDAPGAATALLAHAGLRRVDRVLMRVPGQVTEPERDEALCARMAALGFATPPRRPGQRAVLFRRTGGAATCGPCACGAANRHAERCPGLAAKSGVPMRHAGFRKPGR